MGSEVEELRKEVERLSNQVKKNSKAIVDTGSQLLRVQVDKERRSLKSLNLDSDKPSKVSTTESDDESAREEKGEALTSDDLVELVTELQGQLDLLDERSIRRTANVLVTADDENIAPVPGRNGGYPDDEISDDAEDDRPGKFPATLKEFKNMSDDVLNYWLRWYELLPPDEAELQDILSRAGATMEDLGMDQPQKSAIEATKEEVDKHYDTLARYLGLRTRRTPDTW
ncbi:hypothetical protein TRICI_003468 [Trichomonascus ciferrii]|uniref:Uncharacterized protein n=1 Tax=Trichomonascus ciferrii TaxID=44093 RepID=A0A642V350_9ASCO|nr:hypothetical protein TRICI_003468 [Trichomonascus ciferrii]